MSAPASTLPTDVPPGARRRAILLILGAQATFSVAAAAVKALGGEIPLAEVIFCRNLFALPVLLSLAWQAGGVLPALRTRNPMGHAVRIVAGLVGMAGGFYGYSVLPIATVTALGFTMPLFLTALSVLLLGEKVGPRRWSAVAIGFCGVLLMLDRPAAGLGDGETWATLMVLVGALAWAVAMISIRRMGEKGEAGVTIVLWFAIGATAVGGLASIPVWVWPTPFQWALLVAIGLVSALAQLLMTEAYRAGETTLIAPFEYSGILWTAVLGVALWSEIPDGWDFCGFAVLVGAGLYIWHREVKLGVTR